MALNSLMESRTVTNALRTSDSSCPSRSASLNMAVNFHPSNFHVAAAAIIWFALSSFIEVLPWRHRCTVSVKTLEVVFTKRHGSSDSKPNKPDERNGRQFKVSEADVS